MSTATNIKTQSIARYRGDSAAISIPLYDPDSGGAFNPTGCVLIWTAKSNATDLDSAALVQKISNVGGITVANPSIVSLVPADHVALPTRQSVEWDVQAQNTVSGAVRTVARGTILFLDDVTKNVTLSIPTTVAEPSSEYLNAEQLLAARDEAVAAVEEIDTLIANKAGKGANSDITSTSALTRIVTSSNFAITGGNVGIGTTTNLIAPLTLGSAGDIVGAVDAVIAIARAVDNATSGNGHAFTDASVVTRGGGMSYNSFDTGVRFSGTNNYGHYAAYQAAPTFASSGTLTNYRAFSGNLYIESGTITSAMIGSHIFNPSGAGAIGTVYGHYVEELTKGGTNYAFFSAGSTPSRFGPITVAGTITATGTTAHTFAGPLTSTSTVDNVLSNAVAGTAQKYIRLANTGGDFYLGIERSSAGFFPGAGAYNTVLYSPANPVFIATTALSTSGSLTTGAPSGGTAAAWKLGTVASVSPTSPNRTIEVDIAGTRYFIHAKTTNN